MRHFYNNTDTRQKIIASASETIRLYAAAGYDRQEIADELGPLIDTIMGDIEAGEREQRMRCSKPKTTAESIEREFIQSKNQFNMQGKGRQAFNHIPRDKVTA